MSKHTEALLKAVKALEKLLESDDEQIRIRAAELILKYADD